MQTAAGGFAPPAGVQDMHLYNQYHIYMDYTYSTSFFV